jgi:hypothetical protein
MQPSLRQANASREPLFEESTVIGEDHRPGYLDKSYRSSWTAYFKAPTEPDAKDDDTIISCIEERAAATQGNIPIDRMEPLQVVRLNFILQIFLVF